MRHSPAGPGGPGGRGRRNGSGNPADAFLRDASRAASGAEPPTPGQLRAFVVLADELHFGRAAQRLGIASSSMSETLNRLEVCIGGKLVERSSRRVALTERGEALLPRAIDVLRRLDALTEVGREPARHGQTALRIGLGGAAFGDLTQPVLKAFRALHPLLRLDLHESSGPSARTALDASWDLVMSHLPLAGDQLEAHPVASEPRVMLMPAGHSAADGRDVRLDDFRDDLHIAFAPWAPPVRDYWLGVRERDGERPRVGGVAYTVADVVHQVRCLGLVAMVPRSLASTVSLPGITSAPLVDVSPCVMAVLTRPDEDNPLVTSFIAVSRHVVRRHQAADRVFGIEALR